MPTTEWLNKYESTKDKLACKADLEAHFTKKLIGNMAVDVLDIGPVHFPTGQIFACDPLVELEDTPPFIQTIPAGTYPVKSAWYPVNNTATATPVSRWRSARRSLSAMSWA